MNWVPITIVYLSLYHGPTHYTLQIRVLVIMGLVPQLHHFVRHIFEPEITKKNRQK